MVDNVTEIDTNLELIYSEVNAATSVSDEIKNEKERLQEEWHQKTETIDQLQKISDAVEVLRNKLTENLKLSELILLSEEIDNLNQQCMNVIDPSVRGLRNCYMKEIEEELRTAITESFSKAERRVSELSAVGETDVRHAVDILQVCCFCYVFFSCVYKCVVCLIDAHVCRCTSITSFNEILPNNCFFFNL